jgi:hypothetical protein
MSGRTVVPMNHDGITDGPSRPVRLAFSPAAN